MSEANSPAKGRLIICLTLRLGQAIQGFPLDEDSSADPNHFKASVQDPRSDYAINPLKPMGTLKEGWEIARKRARVVCRFHDLRHTACTRLLEGGVPFAILAQIMGWSASATITMAKRYGHIGDSSLRRAMSVLDFLDRRESMTEKSPELAVVPGTRSA